MKLKPALLNLAKVAAIALALVVLGHLVVNAHRNANPAPPSEDATEAHQPLPPDADPGFLPSSKVIALPAIAVTPDGLPADTAAPPPGPFLFSSKWAPILDAQNPVLVPPVQPQPVFLSSSKIGQPGITPTQATPPTGTKTRQ